MANGPLKRGVVFLRDAVRESIFRNVGMPYRNVIGILLGAIASLLLLTTGTLSREKVVWAFVLAILATLILLVLVRPNILTEYTKEVDRFSWGLLVIVIFGFGLGTLIYQSRSWWIWLWNQYLRINTPAEILLESLFLLGVLLGFFVVRNWGKEQKEFVTGLSGLLSGAFVATIIGDIQAELTPMRALAYYALGFTLSGTLNLLAAARLSAHYTNKRSIASRAMLDFLYGSERAKTIDAYFLKNFEEDFDYAKRRLTETVETYCELVKREFSNRMNFRISARVKAAHEHLAQEDACGRVTEKKKEASNVSKEIRDLEAEADPKKAQNLAELKDRLAQLSQEIRSLERPLIPCFFYELVAIECPEKKPNAPATVQDLNREYTVIYKKLGPADDLRRNGPITRRMFRAGVAIRWQDSLEYIVAPGQYRVSFPYVGSIAGLSLMVRQTIIMNRDQMKQFRSKDYRDGICPRDTEQWRGLDEIDFLSYISIPVVARLGSATENAVGVVNIDTKIFVTPCLLEGTPLEGNQGMFRTVMTPKKLIEYASNLYEQDDQDVEYVEKLTRLIVPVLELYLKCRVGAI